MEVKTIENFSELAIVVLLHDEAICRLGSHQLTGERYIKADISNINKY
jgi:hypothetical protein